MSRYRYIGLLIAASCNGFARCAPTTAAAPPTTSISFQPFDDAHIRGSRRPAVVRFDSASCTSACAAMDPFWGQAAKSFPGTVFRVRCSDLPPEVCAAHGVEARVQGVVFKAWTGSEYVRYTGPTKLASLAAWVQQAVAGRLMAAAAEIVAEADTSPPRCSVDELDADGFRRVLLGPGLDFIRIERAVMDLTRFDSAWETLGTTYPGATPWRLNCVASAQHKRLCESPPIAPPHDNGPSDPKSPLMFARVGGGVVEWYRGAHQLENVLGWVEDRVNATDGRQAQRTFDRIYRDAIWTRPGPHIPRSGTGSMPTPNRQYLDFLREVLVAAGQRTAQPVTLVDGCGDLELMSTLLWGQTAAGGSSVPRLPELAYHGYDVSSVAVERARALVAADRARGEAVPATFTLTGLALGMPTWWRAFVAIPHDPQPGFGLGSVPAACCFAHERVARPEPEPPLPRPSLSRGGRRHRQGRAPASPPCGGGRGGLPARRTRGSGLRERRPPVGLPLAQFLAADRNSNLCRSSPPCA